MGELPLQDAQGQPVADAELPDLADSWMWAHAQATSAAASKGELEGELLQRPERNVSRLLSTRRLDPSQDYFACLVPAFEVGRRRGLGEPLTAAAGDLLTLQPAWTRPFVGAVTLPVYFHWEFSTGPAGDFETLARRIQTPRTYAQGDPAAVQALSQRLSTLGTVPMALDADRLLINQPTPTLYEGALTSLNFVRAALPGGVAESCRPSSTHRRTGCWGPVHRSARRPSHRPSTAPGTHASMWSATWAGVGSTT